MANPFGRNAAQRMIESRDPLHGPGPLLLYVEFRMQHVVHGKPRIVDLHHEARSDDRLVFLAQGLGDSVEVFFVVLVMPILHRPTQLDGDTEGMNTSTGDAPFSAALRWAMSAATCS